MAAYPLEKFTLYKLISPFHSAYSVLQSVFEAETFGLGAIQSIINVISLHPFGRN